MAVTLKQMHLIAGEWVDAPSKFSSSPSSGEAHEFADGSPELIDRAVRAAEDAFWSYGASSRADRAKFLNAIADEIEKRGPEITEIAVQESGLPAGRLEGERGRTTGQLRMFAAHIEKGEYLDRRIDAAMPDRKPAPRPDLRMMERPMGPVGVFGASNFPLAFSTAGGDTASALAAGCPVVVKGHPAHPGTSDLVAQAFEAAIKACGMPAGVFSLVQGANIETGQALVKHPLIKAVGFTGSYKVGKALYDLAVARPEPIPFYGELGSINPMFMMPHAMNTRTDELAKGWAGSLALGAGQFCTNPGIVVVLEGADADAFVDGAVAALSEMGEQVMLTDGIADAYRAGAEKFTKAQGTQSLVAQQCEGRAAKPYLFKVSAKDFMADNVLSEEVFGPLGIVVVASDMDEMVALAKSLDGQLTCTLHLDQPDNELAAQLMPVLERKAGRILANGFPTGVEVCDAMVHGGPFPASTNFGATSVGTLAIRRFLRPVCYQNIPEGLLPADLR